MEKQARHELIEQLFHAALALTPDERGAFLKRSCASDPALLAEVHSLISEHERTGSFMASPAHEISSELLAAPEGSLAGKSLGHFTLQERIGEGGMGVVYRARDTKLGREVAIKVLSEAVAHDTLRLKRFEREAQMLASLNHSNIATIHSLEEFEGVRFIVMELLPGETLDDRIGRGAIPLREALPILSQTAAALQAAHEKGIIHRDLKPANIQLLPGGTLKVLDFGLSKATDVQPDPGVSTIDTIDQSRETIAGTPSYLSPEQFRGEPLDTRADIWAFGCVAYEVLTGEKAFPGKNLLEIAGCVLNLEPDWSKMPATTPAAIRGLIQRCMEKDRDRRLPDIASAKNEIDKLLQRLDGPLGLRSLLQKPKVAVPALVLLVAVLATGISFVIKSRRQSWARNAALPEIARLLDKDDFDGAFRLGQQAERYIPGDPALLEVKRRYAKDASIQSTPPGADVYVKGYRDLDASWLHIVKTPMEGVLVPASYLRWRVPKEGFAPAEGAFHAYFPIRFALHPRGGLSARHGVGPWRPFSIPGPSRCGAGQFLARSIRGDQ